MKQERERKGSVEDERRKMWNIDRVEVKYGSGIKKFPGQRTQSISFGCHSCYQLRWKLYFFLLADVKKNFFLRIWFHIVCHFFCSPRNSIPLRELKERNLFRFKHPRFGFIAPTLAFLFSHREAKQTTKRQEFQGIFSPLKFARRFSTQTLKVFPHNRSFSLSSASSAAAAVVSM